MGWEDGEKSYDVFYFCCYNNSNYIDVCAFFHCHTTLHYCPKTTSRRTGPSQNDLDLAQSYNLPGILRDYEGPEITGGHNINESYKDITFGPTKRPDIQYNDVIK